MIISSLNLLRSVIDILLKHNVDKIDVDIVEAIIERGNMQRFSKNKRSIQIEDVVEIKRILKVANEDWK